MSVSASLSHSVHSLSVLSERLPSPVTAARMTLLEDYGPVLAHFIDDSPVYNELTILLSELELYLLYSEAHDDVAALTQLAGILYELNEYLLSLLTPAPHPAGVPAPSVLPAVLPPVVVVASVQPDPEPDPPCFLGYVLVPVLPDPDPNPSPLFDYLPELPTPRIPLDPDSPLFFLPDPPGLPQGPNPPQSCREVTPRNYELVAHVTREVTQGSHLYLAHPRREVTQGGHTVVNAFSPGGDPWWSPAQGGEVPSVCGSQFTH